MSAQSDRQASIRAVTGTALTYEGDWSALFDLSGIVPGPFNNRLLSWINLRLGSSYLELNGAMQAFAVSQGAPSWGGMGTFVASSAIFLSQNFSGTPGTLITALAPAVGSNWLAQPGVGAGTAAIDAAGTGVYASVAGIWQNNVYPASNDYSVKGVFFTDSIVTNDLPGVIARASNSANTFYNARYQQGSGGVNLVKYNAGSLGSVTGATATIAFTPTVGQTFTIELDCVGTTISVKLNGSVILSGTDATIAAGAAGVRFGTAQTNNTGIHCQSIVASN